MLFQFFCMFEGLVLCIRIFKKKQKNIKAKRDFNYISTTTLPLQTRESLAITSKLNVFVKIASNDNLNHVFQRLVTLIDKRYAHFLLVWICLHSVSSFWTLLHSILFKVIKY